MKNTLKLLIFLSLWHITPSFANASRIALVIGNSQYTQLKPLSNPKNDAKAIGKALRNVGFKLLDNKVLYNLNEMQFLSVIKRFARQAQGTEMALIYYAGHGVQIGSGSYLLPVDIPKNIELIERRGIALDAVLDKLKGKSALNIAIFDACREIPKLEDEANRAGFGSSVRAFGRSSADLGISQIIAYSTASGEYAKDGVGRHSPYTQALLKQLNTSTMDVRALFDQVAYEVSVNTGQTSDVVSKAVPPNTYYFRKPATKPTSVSVSPNAEIAFWNSIANETSAAYFDSYIQQYPRGVYIKLARLKSKQYATPEVVLNSKIAFTVKTSPANARVRILNIAPVYQAGLLLKADSYKVEVSARGYQKQVSDFELTADNAVYFVALKQISSIPIRHAGILAKDSEANTVIPTNRRKKESDTWLTLLVNQVTSQSESNEPDCVFPNQTAAPGWVCGEPLPGLELQAIGFFRKSRAGVDYMKNRAKAAALSNLTEHFKVKASKMVQNYLGVTGLGTSDSISAAASSVIKAVSTETISDAKLYKSRTGPEGRLFLLAGLDERRVREAVEKTVKTSMKNDKYLWQEFKTHQNFDEMAASIARMED